MRIFITDRDGNSHIIEGDNNDTLMEVIRDKSLEIEAACGGCCACATCHVYISEEWQDKLSPIDDDEESMLDQAFHVKNNSRLSCQINLTDDLDGLKIELAPE